MTVTRTGAVEIAPVVDDGLGNTAWLVDLEDGRLLVVDPARDVDAYIGWAEQRARRVAFSAETHLHADFVSGSRALGSAGATVIAPAASRLEFGHRGLDDGDEIDLGGLRLRALATPGHSPEHLSYLLLDDGRPVALFSGGALLVGSVARTDLVSPDRTEELARAAYRSIQERLASLPDELAVYPTHGAGSFCSAAGGNDRVTTMGRERATNPFLGAVDEDAFVASLVAGLGSYPPYFRRLRKINRRGPTLLPHSRPLRPLTPTELRDRIDAGTELIDVRSVEDFASGHVPGALSIPFRPQFATWLGWIVPEGRSVAFVAGEGQDRADLVRQCLKVGYEDLAGELEGGLEAWSASGLPVERIELVGPSCITPSAVLDVRQDSERAAGRIPGSVGVELGSLAERAEDLPSGPLTVMCGHGERAMTGASVLARGGRGQLSVLIGGPEDWAETTGRQLVRGP